MPQHRNDRSYERPYLYLCNTHQGGRSKARATVRAFCTGEVAAFQANVRVTVAADTKQMLDTPPHGIQKTRSHSC
jgi:hypothetical protein